MREGEGNVIQLQTRKLLKRKCQHARTCQKAVDVTEQLSICIRSPILGLADAIMSDVLCLYLEFVTHLAFSRTCYVVHQATGLHPDHPKPGAWRKSIQLPNDTTNDNISHFSSFASPIAMNIRGNRFISDCGYSYLADLPIRVLNLSCSTNFTSFLFVVYLR